MNEVRLTGYTYWVLYEGVEYELRSDVCFDVYLFDGSIEPDPELHGHTPMEIKEFVEQTFFNGGVIGLD